MLVKLLKPVEIAGKVKRVGATVDVSDASGVGLIARGDAERVKQKSSVTKTIRVQGKKKRK